MNYRYIRNNMTAKNDITGDAIITKSSTENFRDGWERTFGKKETKEEDVVDTEVDNSGEHG